MIIEYFSIAKSLLNPSERRKVLWLGLGYVLVGLLETGGVASIGPFMAVLVDPQAAREGRLLGVIYRILEPSSDREFVITVGAVVMVFIAVSSLFTALMTWITSRFVFGQQHRIAERLLSSYLHLPYAKYLRRNTSDLIKTMFLTNNQVVAGFILPATQAFGRLVVALMIVGLLTFLDPALSLSMGAAVGGGYLLIYTRARRNLLQVGEEQAEADRERLRIASDALNGFREVRMYGAEAIYESRFSEPSKQFAKTQTVGEMIATLPRNALEVIAFACLLGVTIYLFKAHGNNASQALPIVALYGFASYRLMGAVQIVFNGIARVRFNSPSLVVLAQELREVSALMVPSDQHGSQLVLKDRIEVTGLEMGYANGKPVLKGVGVDIPAGKTVGIVGPSGAGKSTFVDLLLGLLEPDRGTIRIDGVKLSRQNSHLWRVGIGYVPQSAFLLDGSVAENIAFGVPKESIDMEAVRRSARLAHLEGFVEGLDDGYDTLVGERGALLSGGQRQRIAIARALYRDPAIVVLDEATNALDNVTEAMISKALHSLRGSRTVIMIAHRLATIRECDIILVFDQGRIVGAGTFDELLGSCDTFRKLTRHDHDLEVVQVL